MLNALCAVNSPTVPGSARMVQASEELRELRKQAAMQPRLRAVVSHLCESGSEKMGRWKVELRDLGGSPTIHSIFYSFVPAWH